MDEPLPTIQARLRANVGRATCSVALVERHLELLVTPADRHLWSPWLSVTLVADGAHTQLRARFGPHPSVWTGFMSLFIVWTLLGLSGLMYAAGQMLVREAATGLLALPVCATGAAITWAIMWQGRRLGRPQMSVLYQALCEMITDRGGERENET